MYYLNSKLIDKLPELLGIGRTEFARVMGVMHSTYLRWADGGISCHDLVRICNEFHISLTHFLTLEETPTVKARREDYVVPEDKWEPVKWNHGVAATLFGVKGLLGIPKKDASSMLGFNSYQIFDQWAKSPAAARARDVLNLINTFHLDASQFFSEPNSVLPIPAWDLENKHVVRMVREQLENHQSMTRQIAAKEKEIASLRTDKERLNRELMLLRNNMADRREGSASQGILREPGTAYSPFQRRGYVFHKELWLNLYKMLGMGYTAFCDAVGICSVSSAPFENASVSALVNACNLYRISISHFFLSQDEPAPVHDLGYYQMSSRLFKPVESHTERLKFLFNKNSVTGFTIEDVVRSGVAGRRGFENYRKADGTLRVLTLCDICTRFNLPPWIFFDDDNRRKAVYSQSQNERLLLNAIKLSEENKALKSKIRRLKAKLKAKGIEDPEED